jgi:hypothetical protein
LRCRIQIPVALQSARCSAPRILQQQLPFANKQST